MGIAASDRPLRADARRNRERVLNAAQECFAEQGLEAQMDDVARRAGVGVGTVYRHFPDKQALADALIFDRFTQFAQIAREALQREDPWDALSHYIWRCAELQAEDRAFCQGMTEMVSSDVRNAAAQAAGLLELNAELVERAQQAGAVREDVRTADVPLVMCGVGGVVRAGGGPLGGSWRRYLAMVLDGMRAPGGTPLPE